MITRGIAFAIVVFTTSLFAQPTTPPGQGGTPPNASQLSILGAKADNAMITLHIEGQNICAAPVVTLSTWPLPLTPGTTATPTAFDVVLPAGVPAGTYLMHVSCGNPSKQNAMIDVTLGAVGPQGLKGDKGDQGLTGPEGDTGATGPQGLQGPAGPQGLTGPAGPQGPTGTTGATGPQGIQGEVGPPGQQGPKGETGAQGPQGDLGPAGPKGDTGAAGQQGLVGAQGDSGSQGPQGARGDNGPAGLQGLQGIQGAKGDTGPVGPQGLQGLKGDTGPAIYSGNIIDGNGATVGRTIGVYTSGISVIATIGGYTGTLTFMDLVPGAPGYPIPLFPAVGDSLETYPSSPYYATTNCTGVPYIFVGNSVPIASTGLTQFYPSRQDGKEIIYRPGVPQSVVLQSYRNYSTGSCLIANFGNQTVAPADVVGDLGLLIPPPRSFVP